MFLGAGSRSKTSVRQRLTLKLAAALVNTTPTDGSVTAVKLATSALGPNVGLVNGTLVQSVAASALTVAVKTLAGADPTAADPVYIVFRNATAATGDFTVLTITAALSLVISSGSTMGATSAVAFRLWLVAFNDAGTARLGLINCLVGANIYPLGQFPVASSTAEGGAGAADSAGVFYTGTAVASKAYAVLGYFSWETGLATAGTWSAAATRAELFRPWTPLPGAQLQQTESRTAASSTTSTAIPYDDTIPQITEGSEFMTVAITPSSAANVLRVFAQGSFAASVSTDRQTMALFQDAAANALAAVALARQPAPDTENIGAIDWTLLAGLTTSTTFRIRAGSSTGATTTLTFNGSGGTRKFGGVMNSYLRAQEVMG